MEATFPNPGVNAATFAMDGLTGRCSIVDEPFGCDVRAEYGPRDRCITIEWFASTVDALLESPTTAEALAVAIAGAVAEACTPHYVSATVLHYAQDGVTLKVEASR